jgi:large subunit ribosomal protein L14
MIFAGSKLKVSDNSGALTVRCIKVYGTNLRKAGTVGDVILVSVRTYIDFRRQKSKISLKRKVKKSQICKAIIVRVKKQIKRRAEYLHYSDNAVVLLKNESSLLFTSISGPISSEVRKANYTRILLMANIII